MPSLATKFSEEEPLQDQVWETLKSAPKLQVADARRKACLVHLYPPGPGIGSLYTLIDAPMIVGREEDCDICLNDNSVSRRHLRIQPSSNGYCVIDLKSSNGTYANDRLVSIARLENGDILQIGNQIFRYLSGGSIETAYHEEIFRLTITDALTQIPNKRYLVENLERELARSAQYQRLLGLILFDLDRFKAINDRLGHLAGDGTLRELVRRIQGLISKEELLARYGGEEFAVVLPETTLERALDMAERLRHRVEEQPFQYEKHSYPVTISLGVVITQGDESLTPEDLIRQADGKLYEAKHGGRNCVRG